MLLILSFICAGLALICVVAQVLMNDRTFDNKWYR